jgi:hypothetical protein
MWVWLNAETAQEAEYKNRDLLKQKNLTTQFTLSQTFLTKKHKFKNKPTHNQTSDGEPITK